jgi:hypothetical protein
MNKWQITESVLKSTRPEYTPKQLREYYNVWWFNRRNKEDQAFRLTEQGFEFFTKYADIKFYKINFPKDTVFTNQFILYLDRFITCPYYFDNKFIHVTNDKVAVQLALFEGNIDMFGTAKVKTQQRAIDNTDK